MWRAVGVSGNGVCVFGFSKDLVGVRNSGHGDTHSPHFLRKRKVIDFRGNSSSIFSLLGPAPGWPCLLLCPHHSGREDR